jgi:hypothetical protein
MVLSIGAVGCSCSTHTDCPATVTQVLPVFPNDGGLPDGGSGDLTELLARCRLDAAMCGPLCIEVYRVQYQMLPAHGTIDACELLDGPAPTVRLRYMEPC